MLDKVKIIVKKFHPNKNQKKICIEIKKIIRNKNTVNKLIMQT
jgi:hypothetical protein